MRDIVAWHCNQLDIMSVAYIILHIAHKGVHSIEIVTSRSNDLFILAINTGPAVEIVDEHNVSVTNVVFKVFFF